VCASLAPYAPPSRTTFAAALAAIDLCSEPRLIKVAQFSLSVQDRGMNV